MEPGVVSEHINQAIGGHVEGGFETGFRLHVSTMYNVNTVFARCVKLSSSTRLPYESTIT